MARTVNYTAPDSESPEMRFSRRPEDGVPVCDLTFRVVGDDGSVTHEYARVQLAAGTPPEGTFPASVLVGAGKVFADAAEATAWRDKLVEIYAALRAAKGLV